MKTIVGLFDSYREAEATVRDLDHAGYGRDHISIVAGKAARDKAEDAARGDGKTEGATSGAVIGGVAGGAAGLIASLAGLAIPGIGPVLAAGPLVATLTGAGVGAVAGGLVGALTSAGVPDEHARYYEEGVRRGGTLVTVVAADEQAERVMEIMNRHQPVDIEDRAATWRKSGAAGVAAGPAQATGTARRAESGEQQHIPVVEEELRVGKQQVQTGGVRVNARVQETPVEEQVQLRQEHVRVERHPTDRPATAADFNQAFKGGTIEVTERAEEAVVQKEARVVEEVVVGKEASQRTETVRDTVRRTDVDVRPVEVAGASASGGAEFAGLESDFRNDYRNTHRGSDYEFDKAIPAYRYGYELASDRSRGGGEWGAIEPDARRGWEERNPGTWEKFKDAARYAYDRAREKVGR